MYRKSEIAMLVLAVALTAGAAFSAEIPVMVFKGDVKLQGTGNVLAMCNGSVLLQGIGNLYAKGFGWVEMSRGAQYCGKDGVWHRIDAPTFKLELAGKGQITIKSNGTDVKAVGVGNTWIAGQGTGTVLLSGSGLYKSSGLAPAPDSSAQVE
jgi:CRISPR/Cas system CSM-associated protein Csm3 (group 7 of RAMP superfamily)